MPARSLVRSLSGRPAAVTRGAALLVALLVGCTSSPSGDGCLVDAECTVPGETCLAASCGCDPGAATDTCAASDKGAVCHPDDARCAPSCSADSECTTSGERCDLATRSCRDPAKIDCTRAGATCPATTHCSAVSRLCEPRPDCTEAGHGCVEGEVCDAGGTKVCVPACTSTSCGVAHACNAATRLCEADCKADGVACPEGTVCDEASSICVAKCGEGSCSTEKICSDAGLCVARCDAPDTDVVCPRDTVCDRGITRTGRCLTDCRVEGGPCSARQFCGPDGLCASRCATHADCAGGAGYCRSGGPTDGQCETRIPDIAACGKPGAVFERTYLSEADNACLPTSDFETCADVTRRDANKPDSVDGPTAWGARFVSYESVNEDGVCIGLRATVQVAWYDWDGDLATSGFNTAVRLAAGSTGGDDDPYSNTAPRAVGTPTGHAGVLEFTLCRAAASDARPFAAYLKDKNNHYGNTICFEVPVP